MTEDGPTFMVSEEMHEALREDLGDRKERRPSVRLALPHFNEAEAAMMWDAMEEAHEAEADEESLEGLGRLAEIQAGRRGYPMTSKDFGVPVAEGTRSLKERAKAYE